MPKPLSPRLYDRNYYQTKNHGYSDYQNQFQPAYQLRQLIKPINFSDKTILDLGCGRGEIVITALKRRATKAVGIDYSPAALKFCLGAKKQLPLSLQSKCIFLRMDTKNIKLKSGSFDLIFLFDIIEHLHPWELQITLSEVSRLLKPDGQVFFHTSPNRHLMDIVRLFTFFTPIRLQSSVYHINEQTPSSLLQALNPYFTGHFLFEKDRKYWSSQMVNRGPILKTLGYLADIIYDHPFLDILIKRTFLKHYFTTGFSFIGRLR